MHLAAALEANEQTLEVVEMSEGALDHPAHAAKSGAVLGLAASDEWSDPALAEETAVLVVVVATIGDEAHRLAPGTATHAGNGRHRLEQRDQLGDVVAVAARDRPGERDSGRIDQEVVL